MRRTLSTPLSIVLLTATCSVALAQAGTAVHHGECQHPANPLRRHADCLDEDFNWDETFEGGWSGIRVRMRKIGVTPTMSYTGALQTNASGGQHQVWSYAGQLSMGFAIDLRRVLKIPGTSAYVGMSWGTGSNLTGSLGNSLPTNALYAPGFYLGEMYLRQNLLEGKFKLAAGRLSASNSFATLPVFANYVSYGINPNPFSIGSNDITFFGPPTGTQWGSKASYKLSPVIEISAGIFNTNVNSANGEGHGTDFSWQEGNKGVLAISEIDYLHNQRMSDRGKPGQYTVGLLHNDNSFATLPDSQQKSAGYTGIYVMGQQMVYCPNGPATSKGLTTWATWTYNSKQLVNPMPMFAGAGLSYEGLISARQRDIVSAGWIYGKASKFVPGTTEEQMIEVNYQWRHSQYLVVIPQFQYIRKPSGRSFPDAAVAGIQIALTF